METKNPNKVVDALSTELGDAIIHDQESLATVSRDWWPRAAKWSAQELRASQPLCIIRPRTTEEVQKAVRAVAALNAALVPYGAGSGVCGAVCSGGHVVLDMRAMAALKEFSEEDGLVTVQAGMPAAQLEQWLVERGYTTGHYPQSLPLATVGGLVATRSSGTFSAKYGNIEDLVVGLEVVLADGTLVGMPARARAATGPDLKQLFVGSEGSLGVITQVTLRVFPGAEKRLFAGYAFPGIEHGLAAVKEAFARHTVPAVLRLYDDVEAQGLYRRVGSDQQDPLLIVGHEGATGLVAAEAEAFKSIAIRHGGSWLGEPIGNAWEQHRFDASWIQKGNDGPIRMADAIEVSAGWSELGNLYRAALRRIDPLCTSAMAHWSHFYSNGGALYIIFNVIGADQPDAIRRYEEVWAAVMEVTLQHGGAISHHHGIGKARGAYLQRELGSGAELLVRVKDALDPKHVLNPRHLGARGVTA